MPRFVPRPTVGGYVLRSYLSETGESAASFGAGIGVSESYLRQLLTGRRRMPRPVAQRIVRRTKGVVTLDMWRLSRAYPQR